MPQADSYKGYWAPSKSSYQMPQCKTEPSLRLSDNDGQNLPIFPVVLSGCQPCTAEQEAGGGILHRHLSSLKQFEPWEGVSSDPVRAHRTLGSSTILTSIRTAQNKMGSICVWCVPCWRCQTSAEPPSTLCLVLGFIVCHMRDDNGCDLQANKNLIQGFGPRDMID